MAGEAAVLLALVGAHARHCVVGLVLLLQHTMDWYLIVEEQHFYTRIKFICRKNYLKMNPLKYSNHCSIIGGRLKFMLLEIRLHRALQLTGVSYKWYPSVGGLPNLYSVIDGSCTLKVENNCYTENTFDMKQALG